MSFFNKEKKNTDGQAMAGAFKKTTVFGQNPLFTRASTAVKNMSRRDMALVGLGFTVLVSVPVVQHMVSKPADTYSLSASGFGSREGVVSDLYEPGINSMSTGSSDGSGEVITPLSTRDPGSLILGSQAPQLPPPAPATNWRDAVSTRQAARPAPAPAPKASAAPTSVPKMQASLRSMSFFGGDGSSRSAGTLGAGSGSEIIKMARSSSAKSVSRSLVGPVAMAGYKGVAFGGAINTSSKDSMEKLREAAGQSAGVFTGGSATGALDRAMSDSIPGGASGDGGPGYGGKLGEEIVSAKSYDNKYTHMRSGESLAEMAAKQRLQKKLEWEFFLKYDIPKKIINDLMGALTKAITEPFGDKKGSEGSGGGGSGGGSGGGKGGGCGSGDCGAAGGSKCPPGVDCSGGGPNGAPAQAAKGSDPRAVFKGYDQTLQEMIQEVQKGQGASEPEEMIESGIKTADGFPKLQAGSVADAVRSRAAQARSNEVAGYDNAVKQAKEQLKTEKEQYDSFKGNLESLLAEARSGGMSAGTKDGVEAVTEGKVGNTVEQYINSTALPAMEARQKNIEEAEKQLGFHDKSVQVHKNQTGQVEQKAGEVASKVSGVVSQAQSIKSELTSLKAELEAALQAAKDEEERERVKEEAKSKAQQLLTKLAQLMEQGPINWRGAQGMSLNDSGEYGKEQGAWAQATPRGKYSDGNSSPQDSNNLAPNLLAGSMRGGTEVPGDAAASTPEPMKAVRTNMDPVKATMSEIANTLTYTYLVPISVP